MNAGTMKLPTEVFGSVVVVHTPEEIGQENADALTACLTTLERASVIVDLDGTESIDSAGLTALVDALDLLREAGGNLKISATGKVNRKILEITRLDEQIEIFDSVIDAVRSYA